MGTKGGPCKGECTLGPKGGPTKTRVHGGLEVDLPVGSAPED